MRSISTIISKFGKNNARSSAKLIVRTNGDQFAWQAPLYALRRAAMHALGLKSLGMSGVLVPVTTRVGTTPVTDGTCCEQSQHRPGRRNQMRRRVIG
ncbi:MAG: hypothetical protein KF847_14020 [Pirellulales bacterium]|nr:hypothetical protein [Pirellulales bacterium]